MIRRREFKYSKKEMLWRQFVIDPALNPGIRGQQATLDSLQFKSQQEVYLRPGNRSRYSDLLRAGPSRGRGSSPGGGKNFHFSKSSRPPLGSAQPPIQWVPGALSPGVK
jgi:hypothetical protein